MGGGALAVFMGQQNEWRDSGLAFRVESEENEWLGGLFRARFTSENLVVCTLNRDVQ